MNRDRDKIPPVDIALENIKQILIVGFGIKLKDKPKDVVGEFAETPLGTFSFTTAEKEAWLEAGMPEIQKFLKDHRDGH